MYKQALLVVSITLINGCTSGPSDQVVDVMWHGASPAREYTFTFVDDSNSPIQGVTFNCYGEEDSIADYVASDLNQSAVASDELGKLIISHDGFKTHGTYKQKGTNRWGFKTSDLPNCEFYFEKRTVLSGHLLSLNASKTVVISE